MAAITGVIKNAVDLRTGYYCGRALTRTSNGDIHAFWVELTGGEWILHHNVSDDQGATWGAGTLIVNNGAFQCDRVKCTTDYNDNLHIVYELDDGGGNWDTEYRSSSDNGATWSAPTTLWDGSVGGDSKTPAIAVDSVNALHVVANRLMAVTGETDIEYRYSSDTGTTWDVAETVVTDVGGNDSYSSPTIEIGSGDIPHVVGNGDHPVAVKLNPWYTNRSGGAWAAITWLDARADQHMYYPDIVIDSADNIYVVYDGADAGGNYQMYANRYTGGAWQGVEQLTAGAVWHFHHNLMLDTADKVYAFYLDITANNVEYVKYDGGWGAETLVRAYTSHVGTCRMTTIGGNFPKDSDGFHLNMPSAGFIISYGDDIGATEDEKFYGADGTTWEPYTPGVTVGAGRTRTKFNRARRRPGTVC